MTTTERPADSSTKPVNLTEEYEVVMDGRTYMCKRIEYLGDEYEVCRRVKRLGAEVHESAPQPFLKPGDSGYEELVDYLNQFLIPGDDVSVE